MPIKPRAVAAAPPAGWPARTTSIAPSRNVTSFSTAYDSALPAVGSAITCTAFRPLKLVCAIATFLATSRSGLCPLTEFCAALHASSRTNVPVSLEFIPVADRLPDTSVRHHEHTTRRTLENRALSISDGHRPFRRCRRACWKTKRSDEKGTPSTG